MNLNEEMLSKSKSSSQSSSQSDKPVESTVRSLDSTKANKKQSVVAALSKYTSIIPEKVCEYFLLGDSCFSFTYLFSVFLFLI